MLVCTDARLELWEPDFSSSDQANPRWTRVTVAGSEICNGLEGVAWEDEPVQFVLCDACGYAGCAAGGWAHVSRLGAWLLATAPFPEDGPDRDDADESDHVETEAHWVRRHGGLAMPASTWNAWRARVRGMPEISAFPRATGAVLADAWRMSVVGPGRVDRLGDVASTLRRNLLACDTLTVEEAITAVEALVADMTARPQEALAGALVTPQSIGARIETLYFDAPQEAEWHALALRNGEILPALGEELVYLPEV